MKSRGKVAISALIAILIVGSLVLVFTLTSTSEAAQAAPNMNKEALDPVVLSELKKLTQAEGEIIVCASDRKLIFLSPGLEPLMEVETPHGAEIHAVAVSPDKSMMVSGDKKGRLIVWNLTGEQVTSVPQAHMDDIKDIVFSRDGKFLVTASKDRSLKVWDAAGLTCLSTLKGHKSYVLSCDISPDGSKIASVGMDNKLILWETATGGKIREKAESHFRAVNQVCFSPDGISLYTGSADALVKVWDVETLSCRSTLKGQVNEIISLAATPGGEWVISAGRDKALYLFNAASGDKEAVIDLPGNVYSSGMAFDASGTGLYLSDQSGDLLLIDLLEKKVVKQSKQPSLQALEIF